jgi:endonuclease YncB( thermonuclease family)
MENQHSNGATLPLHRSLPLSTVVLSVNPCCPLVATARKEPRVNSRNSGIGNDGAARRCRYRCDPLARQQQPERHLHDTAATGAACVNVSEAALLKFSDGARIDGHAGVAYRHRGLSRYVAARGLRLFRGMGQLHRMDRTIRFKYRHRFPRTFSVLSLLLVAVGVATALAWLAWPSLQPKLQTVITRPQPATGGASQVTIIGGGKIISGPLFPGEIYVNDGDTITVRGQQYRLVGFDTPETGLTAKCQRERDLAARATLRLRQLVARGGLRLQRVACSCQPGTEGSYSCNYGRWCGTLTVAGRDVGPILISEGLARSYVCGRTSCPPRQGWC